MNQDFLCSASKKTATKISCVMGVTFFLIHANLILKKVVCLVMLAEPHNQ